MSQNERRGSTPASLSTDSSHPSDEEPRRLLRHSVSTQSGALLYTLHEKRLRDNLIEQGTAQPAQSLSRQHDLTSAPFAQTSRSASPTAASRVTLRYPTRSKSTGAVRNHDPRGDLPFAELCALVRSDALRPDPRSDFPFRDSIHRSTQSWNGQHKRTASQLSTRARAKSSAPNHPAKSRDIQYERIAAARPGDMRSESPFKDGALSARQLQPKPSKFSISSLFSKPKVERQRGYAEAGLTIPPQPPYKDFNPTHRKGRLALAVEPPRADSSMSFLSTATRTPADRHKTLPQRPPPTTTDSDYSPWQPVPLFQAYAQSVKYGIVQVSTNPASMAPHKSKRKTPSGLPIQATDTGPRASFDSTRSIETKRPPRTSVRQSIGPFPVHRQPPQKIVVLTASGLLLQYNGVGPYGRLPEHAMQLCKDSTVSVHEISGKLQISHAIDQRGRLTSKPESFFGRLGRDSTKRTISPIVLVAPDSEEKRSWLTALRQEIEKLGGSRASADILRGRDFGETNSRRRQEGLNLENVPTTNRPEERGPNGRSLDVSGVLENAEPASTMQRNSSIRSERSINSQGPARRSSVRRGSPLPMIARHTDDPSELASRVAVDNASSRSKSNNVRSSLDTTSTAATSVDHQGSTVHRRQSYSTIATSRTNSMTMISSAPAASSEVTSSDVAPTNRTSSYSSATKRRSAMPTRVAQDNQPPQEQPRELRKRGSVLAAGLGGIQSPRASGKGTRINMPADEPATQDTPTNWHTQPGPATTPPAAVTADNAERPVSFVGDLPSKQAWSNPRSMQRSSLAHQQIQKPVHKSASQPSLRDGQQARPRRRSSQPFGLRINPSSNTPTLTRPERPVNSSNDDNIPAERQTHTLVAKIDSHRPTPPESNHEPLPAISNPNQHSQQHYPSPRVPSSSNKLSLFPPPGPPPTTPLPPDPSSHNYNHNNSSKPPLHRPASLQVRTSHAPFLASRTLHADDDGDNCNQTPRTQKPTGNGKRISSAQAPVPIRSLKPSRSANFALPRSATSLPAQLGATSLQAPDINTNANINTNPNSNSNLHPHHHLHPHPQLPPPPSTQPPTSRPRDPKHQDPGNHPRLSLRQQTSLPRLEFGTPVVGLGPPTVPPPGGPLPRVPLPRVPLPRVPDGDAGARGSEGRDAGGDAGARGKGGGSEGR
ncbi:hypothetical protein MBLNU230_g5040t1 [Neophaeotheca triangularis]